MQTDHRSDAAAQAFIALASGEADRVPWARSVSYTINGTLVATLDPARGMAAGLSSCLPGKATVEGHRCPVSPLTTVGRAGVGAVTTHTFPKHVGCNVYTRPAGVTVSSSAVIRPPADQRTCIDDFAVTLSLDEAGEVQGIDLALSSP